MNPCDKRRSLKTNEGTEITIPGLPLAASGKSGCIWHLPVHQQPDCSHITASAWIGRLLHLTRPLIWARCGF